MPEEDANYWKERGDDYVKQVKYEKAIECYKKAIDLDPEYISAWNNIGYSLSKLGRKDEAKIIKEKINELKNKEKQPQETDRLEKSTVDSISEPKSDKPESAVEHNPIVSSPTSVEPTHIQDKIEDTSKQPLELIIKEIEHLLAQEKKETTLNFALIRGVIDLCKDQNVPVIEIDDYVFLPLGLLVEKWIDYYFVLLCSDTFIPQVETEHLEQPKLAFRPEFIEFKRILEKNKLSYFEFKELLIKDQLNQEIATPFCQLSKKIRNTIVEESMRHLGNSLHKIEYSIFNYDHEITDPSCSSSDVMHVRSMLQNNFGLFFMKKPYYLVFLHFGDLILGNSCLLSQWAQFCKDNDSSGLLTEDFVLNKLKYTQQTIP